MAKSSPFQTYTHTHTHTIHTHTVKQTNSTCLPWTHFDSDPESQNTLAQLQHDKYAIFCQCQITQPWDWEHWKRWAPVWHYQVNNARGTLWSAVELTNLHCNFSVLHILTGWNKTQQNGIGMNFSRVCPFVYGHTLSHHRSYITEKCAAELCAAWRAGNSGRRWQNNLKNVIWNSLHTFF